MPVSPVKSLSLSITHHFSHLHLCLSPLQSLDEPSHGGTHQPPHCGVISFLPEEHKAFNTLKNRTRFAEQLIKINNSPSMQTMGYGRTQRFTAKPGQNKMRVAGDLTPQDTSKLQPFSDFMTLSDTMDMLCELFPADNGMKNTPADLITQDDILSDYYSPDKIPKVKALYGLEAQARQTGVDVEQLIGSDSGITDFQFQED